MHHFCSGKCANAAGLRPYGCVCRVEQIAKLTASLTSTKSPPFMMSCICLQLWHFDGFGGENDVPTKWTLVMLDVF